MPALLDRQVHQAIKETRDTQVTQALLVQRVIQVILATQVRLARLGPQVSREPMARTDKMDKMDKTARMAPLEQLAHRGHRDRRDLKETPEQTPSSCKRLSPRGRVPQRKMLPARMAGPKSTQVPTIVRALLRET